MIYTNKVDYIKSVQRVLKQLGKYLLYANLDNIVFIKEKVQFLSYIVFLHEICIEKEQIKALRNWFKF